MVKEVGPSPLKRTAVTSATQLTVPPSPTTRASKLAKSAMLIVTTPSLK